MAAFLATQNLEGAPTSVPMRRRVARQPDFTPAWASPMVQPPAAPHQRQVFGTPAWPAAPESPPLFTPPAVANFPSAAPAAPAWIPQVYPPEAPPVSSPGVFGIAEYQPGLPQPLPQAPLAHSYPPPAVPIDFAAMRESPPMLEADMETWRPPRYQSSVIPYLALLIVVVGTCLWVLKEDPLPPIFVEIPVAKPTTSVVKNTPALPESPIVTTPPTAPPPPPAEPEPEIRRAEVVQPKIDLVAAGEAGQKLFLDLIEAATPEARSALIAQPEENGADVEEFFAAGKVELLAFKPSNATPLTLPGQDSVPLFQVTTKANSHGALLRLVPQSNGSFLLDWPLFAETHQRKLAGFLEKKPTEPVWFHLGLRRSHGLEFTPAIREIHVAFKLQGSADGSLSCVAVAQKDTPIGRYLARETDWTDIYIARLLLQHRKLADGTDAIVILDCEGAAKADLQ